jgi:iron complex outermembrane receptor protein
MEKSIIVAGLMLYTANANAVNGTAAVEDPFWQEVPTVITPTRLKQPIRDVPASISVITADMIRNLDIRTIPEALRLVPGMTVTYVAGNQPEVSYHGTNIMAPRRMQVLIDGMSVYRTGKAEMDWSQIPVSIEDIDRIEVVRGPNSASYGANSAVGVVNIITKHPEDDWGTRTKLHGGSDGVRDTYLRYGGSFGPHNYRVSVSQASDDGFDKNIDNENRRDSTDISRVNFSAFFNINDNNKLELTTGLVECDNEVEFIDASQTTFPDIELENRYFQGKWLHNISDQNEFAVKAYYLDEDRTQRWNSCLPQIMFTPELRAMHAANPDYAATLLAGGIPSGGTPQDNMLAFDVFARVAALGGVQGALSPTCGWVNQDFQLTKRDLEIQDTIVFNDNARMIIGIGTTTASIVSQTYFTSGAPDVENNRLFSNLEYRFGKFTGNAGVMIEDESILDDRETSPRIALHYNLDDSQVIKLVTSRAVRTPDPWELALDWNYFVTDLMPPVVGESNAFFYYSPPGDFSSLRSEEIISKEIIWYGSFQQTGIDAEIKIFRENLNDLISEKLQFFDFVPTNNGETEIEGIETDISYRFSHKAYARLAYSYQDISTNDPLELSFHAKHSGSIISSYTLDSGYTLTGSYYANSAIAGFDYKRFDFSVVKVFNIASGNLRASFLYRYMPAKQGGVNRGFSPSAADLTDGIIENDFDSDNHFFLTLDYGF